MDSVPGGRSSQSMKPPSAKLGASGPLRIFDQSPEARAQAQSSPPVKNHVEERGLSQPRFNMKKKLPHTETINPILYQTAQVGSYKAASERGPRKRLGFLEGYNTMSSMWISMQRIEQALQLKSGEIVAVSSRKWNVDIPVLMRIHWFGYIDNGVACDVVSIYYTRSRILRVFGPRDAVYPRTIFVQNVTGNPNITITKEMRFEEGLRLSRMSSLGIVPDTHFELMDESEDILECETDLSTILSDGLINDKVTFPMMSPTFGLSNSSNISKESMDPNTGPVIVGTPDDCITPQGSLKSFIGPLPPTAPYVNFNIPGFHSINSGIGNINALSSHQYGSIPPSGISGLTMYNPYVYGSSFGQPITNVSTGDGFQYNPVNNNDSKSTVVNTGPYIQTSEGIVGSTAFQDRKLSQHDPNLDLGFGAQSSSSNTIYNTVSPPIKEQPPIQPKAVLPPKLPQQYAEVYNYVIDAVRADSSKPIWECPYLPVDSLVDIDAGKYSSILISIARDQNVPQLYYTVSIRSGVSFPEGLDSIQVKGPTGLVIDHLQLSIIPELRSNWINDWPNLSKSGTNWLLERDSICNWIVKRIGEAGFKKKNDAYKLAWSMVEYKLNQFKSYPERITAEDNPNSTYYISWKLTEGMGNLNPDEKFYQGMLLASQTLVLGSKSREEKHHDYGAWSVMAKSMDRYIDQLWTKIELSGIEENQFNELQTWVWGLLSYRLRIDSVLARDTKLIKEELHLLEDNVLAQFATAEELYNDVEKRCIAEHRGLAFRSSLAGWWTLLSILNYLRTYRTRSKPKYGFEFERKALDYRVSPILNNLTTSNTDTLAHKVQTMENKNMESKMGNVNQDNKNTTSNSKNNNIPKLTTSTMHNVSGVMIPDTADVENCDFECLPCDSVFNAASGVFSTNEFIKTLILRNDLLPQGLALEHLFDPYAYKDFKDYWLRWERSDDGCLYGWVICKNDNVKIAGPSPTPVSLCLCHCFNICPLGWYCGSSHPVLSTPELEKIRTTIVKQFPEFNPKIVSFIANLLVLEAQASKQAKLQRFKGKGLSECYQISSESIPKSAVPFDIGETIQYDGKGIFRHTDLKIGIPIRQKSMVNLCDSTDSDTTEMLSTIVALRKTLNTLSVGSILGADFN